MRDFPSPEWMAAFQQVVNSDEELAVIGNWFTIAFLFQAGDAQFLFRVERGRLVEIVPSPRFDQPWTFALRAPAEHWRNFIKPLRVPEFKLEGNTLAAMQNARALQRFMSLMRAVGG
jgi:hypothetical protein